MASIGRFSVLLRNGSHYELYNTRLTTPVTVDGITYPIGNNWGWKSNSGGNSGTSRYGVALKCDNVAIAYSKSPIQIPIPQKSPELIDLGIFRPSITLSGLVDSTSNVAADGYDGERIDSEAGDVMIVENGCVHQHFNTSPNEEYIVLVMKAKPLFLFMHMVFQKNVKMPPKEVAPGQEDYAPPVDY